MKLTHGKKNRDALKIKIVGLNIYKKRSSKRKMLLWRWYVQTISTFQMPNEIVCFGIHYPQLFIEKQTLLRDEPQIFFETIRSNYKTKTNNISPFRVFLRLAPVTVFIRAGQTGLKNGWTCAVKPRSSSRHSIFKMADDESKSNTSL